MRDPGVASPVEIDKRDGGCPFDSSSPNRLWSFRRHFGRHHHRSAGGRLGGDCLLHEPIRQLAATFDDSARKRNMNSSKQQGGC